MTTNLAILFMISWRYLKLPVPQAKEIMKFEAVRAVLRVILRDSALSVIAILGSFVLLSYPCVEPEED